MWYIVSDSGNSFNWLDRSLIAVECSYDFKFMKAGEEFENADLLQSVTS